MPRAALVRGIHNEGVPEGDTVVRAARDLHRALAGRRLEHADLRVPRFSTLQLAGRDVDEVTSRGKHLLTRMGDLTLHTHLGMDGSWRVMPTGRRWPTPAHKVRVVLATSTAVAVGIDLAVVEVVPRGEESRAVGHLGPDILGDDWDPDTAVANLAAQPDRELAAALLDQRNLAGLGNEYVTELCFLRGLLPSTPVADAGDLRPIVDLARRLLAANLDRNIRVFTGDTRAGRRTFVYGREGRPCLRCGNLVEGGRHASLDPEELAPGTPPSSRRSAWCPRCQRDSAGLPLGVRP